MRVLQVVHGFLPYSRAGTELQTYRISKYLARKHQVAIFHPYYLHKNGFCITKSSMDGILIYKIGLPRNYHPLLRIFNLHRCRQIDNLFRLVLKEFNPDIIHFQHLIGLSMSLIDICKVNSIPCVMHLRDFWYMCPTIDMLRPGGILCTKPDRCHICYANKLSTALHHKFNCSFLIYPLQIGSATVLRLSQVFDRRNVFIKDKFKKVDILISPSMFLKKMYECYGYSSSPIIYSPNGIEPFNVVKTPSEKVRIGFAGVIRFEKGVHILIEAFRKLKGYPCEVKIYGWYADKNYYDKLKKLAEGITEIQFLGKYEQVEDVFSNIDVLVLPSICYENCPNIILEAFHARIPIIVSNIGGMAEMVEDGRTGLHFKAGDSSDLASKIKMIIENPGKLKIMSSNIKKVKTVQEQVIELEQIYKNIIQGKS